MFLYLLSRFNKAIMKGATGSWTSLTSISCRASHLQDNRTARPCRNQHEKTTRSIYYWRQTMVLERVMYKLSHQCRRQCHDLIFPSHHTSLICASVTWCKLSREMTRSLNHCRHTMVLERVM